MAKPRWASGIPPEDVLWLDDKRVPRLGPTFFVGFGGVGKSTLACEKAARWSRQGETVLLSLQEDIPEGATVIPRLMAAEAKLNRIILPPRGKSWDFSKHEDVQHFAVYAKMHDVTVAIFDPLDTHIPDVSNPKGRMQIQDLMNAAKPLGITIVFCHHFNKGAKDIRTGIGGARGVYNSARSIFVIGQLKGFVVKDDWTPSDNDDDQHDPEDARAKEGDFIFEAQHKNSYEREQPTHCYERTSVTLDKLTSSVPKLTFTGESEMPADLVFKLNASRSVTASTTTNTTNQSEQQKAQTLIANFLDMKSPMRGSELQDRVMACGITKHTFELARKAMATEGLITKHRRTDQSGKGYWEWEIATLDIPDHMSAPPPPGD